MLGSLSTSADCCEGIALIGWAGIVFWTGGIVNGGTGIPKSGVGAGGKVEKSGKGGGIGIPSKLAGTPAGTSPKLLGSAG